MTLHLSSNRIYINDATMGVIFDTGAGLFRAMDFKNSYVDVPSYAATSTPTTVTVRNVDTTYTLESINANATDVIGMIQLSRTPAGSNPATHADPSGRWQAVNGSKLDFNWVSGPQTAIISITDLIYDNGIGWFTFACSGGSLTMREELSLRAAQNPSGATITATRAATRVFYRLYCGSFV